VPSNSQLPRFKELVALRTFEKPPCKAVFSFSEKKITPCLNESQEEPSQTATYIFISKQSVIHIVGTIATIATAVLIETCS